MTRAPQVSVVMSVYNGALDLPRSLGSILQQSFEDFELIAVDDGSTDGSGDILDAHAARDSRIQVIHQDNRGLGPALHAACLRARGELLARHDSDDLSAPTRLARQVEYLRARPDVALCGTWAWFVHPLDGPVAAWEVPDDAPLLREFMERGRNPLVHGSVMLRRSVYLREGVGYRFKRDGEDFDLWLRLIGLGDLGCVPSVEYLYSLNPHGLSFGFQSSRREVYELCLRLHRERRDLGREVTDFQEETARIYAARGVQSTERGRRTVIAYAQGIDALRAGRWSAFADRMREAARGEGLFADKARRRVRLAWAAPVLRALYDLRVRRSPERFYRYLPPGTPLPPYAMAPAFS